MHSYHHYFKLFILNSYSKSSIFVKKIKVIET